MDSSEIKYLLLKRSIENLQDLLDLISDGYNPSSVSISKNTKIQSEDEMIYDWLDYDWGVINGFVQKNEITDLEERLDDNFNWVLDHLTMFKGKPEVLSNKRWRMKINQIIIKIKKEFLAYIGKRPKMEIYEYFIDHDSERRNLVLKGEECILIHFGNWIH